jgi:hypothetical protein
MYEHGLLEILPMVQNSVVGLDMNVARLCSSENGVDHMRGDSHKFPRMNITSIFTEEKTCLFLLCMGEPSIEFQEGL